MTTSCKLEDSLWSALGEGNPLRLMGLPHNWLWAWIVVVHLHIWKPTSVPFIQALQLWWLSCILDIFSLYVFQLYSSSYTITFIAFSPPPVAWALLSIWTLSKVLSTCIFWQGQIFCFFHLWLRKQHPYSVISSNFFLSFLYCFATMIWFELACYILFVINLKSWLLS